MRHPRDLRGKPVSEATGADTELRVPPTPSCFSWGNSTSDGPWPGTVAASSARPPQPCENAAEACVGRVLPASYPAKLGVPAGLWNVAGASAICGGLEGLRAEHLGHPLWADAPSIGSRYLTQAWPAPPLRSWAQPLTITCHPCSVYPPSWGSQDHWGQYLMGLGEGEG